jgi:hypothetical protein
MPPTSNDARIRCQLFDYLLQDSGKRTHQYEALSYVWGSSDKPRSILIDERDLPITVNLHEALLSLRDPYIERIIWIDAICINQGDKEERAQQVQFMAKVYSKASRVVVWLGQAAKGSDHALEQILNAADDESPKPSNNETNQQPIPDLLQRPWFQRIWVKAQNLKRISRSY